LPSEKILSEKQQYVAALAERLKNSAAGVVVDYKGITVADDTALRKSLREAGVQYEVVKNTMLKLAAKEAGLEGLNSVLEGTTALATSAEDPIAAAKVLGEFAEKNKNFTIKAGFMDGQVIDAAKVTAVGKLPSKEQLVGQLLSVLVAPIRGMAVALNAIAEQKESA
jgi:large subunit ribosomal protein L10